METYDVIVVGVGGMGSACCLELARRGLSVLGLEQFELAHELGSSHGHTRITRKAYFEHPNYVPLLNRTFELWQGIEAESDSTLQRLCGVLLAGPADGAVIPGVRRSAEVHGLDVESIEPADLDRRFEGFAVPDDHAVLYEPGAGLLLVDRCVATMADLARRHGAEILEHSPATAIEPGASGIKVHCGRDSYAAAHGILTAGPWAAGLTGGADLRLEVLRKVQLWYDVPEPCYHIDRGCPVFGFETAAGAFVYGMPVLDDHGLKAAEHSGRDVVADPSDPDRTLSPEDHRSVEALLRPHLPRVDWRLKSHSVCMYTMTPDEHFVIDRHRHHERLLIAAGFSGHGFKFAPLVGEVMADFIQHGRTEHAVGFLNASRL